MRSIALGLLLVVSAWSLEYNIVPKKVSDGMWCVFGDLMPPTKENKGFVSNICWVENSENLILLDAGPTAKFANELEKIIGRTTPKKVSTVVITNYHDDRILAATYFQERGAKVVAHKNIISDIQNNPQKFERLPRLLPPSLYANTKLPKIDIAFESEKLDLGAVILYKMSKIAETPSDIVAYMPKQKAVFAGNILFGDRAINYDKDSNINGWLEALEKIEKLDALIYIPGHGLKSDATSFDETKRYLGKLYSSTKKAYEEGTELEKITQTIPMPEFSYLINYKDRHTQNLYNLYEHFELERVK